MTEEEKMNELLKKVTTLIPDEKDWKKYSTLAFVGLGSAALDSLERIAIALESIANHFIRQDRKDHIKQFGGSD